MTPVTCCLESLEKQAAASTLQDIHKGDGLKNPVNRVYSTNAAEPWHVDDADVVGDSHPPCRSCRHTVQMSAACHAQCL